MKTLNILLGISGFLTLPFGFPAISAGYILYSPFRTKPGMSIKQNILFAMICLIGLSSYEYVRIQSDKTTKDNKAVMLLQTIKQTDANSVLTVEDIKTMMVIQQKCWQSNGATILPNNTVVQQAFYDCLSTELAKKGYTMAQFVQIGAAAKTLNNNK